ncbi:MAG: hypothetical protein HY866_12425 [Chloroflexi bacterium]|nr:hypothetical protein [Chloroflexota bacterium]
MGQFDEQIKQAVAVFKAGRKQEARDILMEIVDQDERHEQAWLLLSGMVETVDEQQICLENVLAINPTSEKALKGLESLKQKRPGQPPTAAFSSPFSGFETPAAPPPTQTPPKRGASAPIGADDMSLGADIFGTPPASTPAAGSAFEFPAQFSMPAEDTMDWLTGGAATPPASTQPDPFAIPSSVDWGRSDKPAAHGSGRQVELPSAQEYDEWVQNLNLGGNPPGSNAAPASTTPPNTPSNDPFDGAAVYGDTSFMVDSGPFMADEPASDLDSGSTFETSWGTKSPAGASDRAFSSVTQGPFSSYDEEDTGPMSSFSAAAEASPAAYGSSESDELPSFSFDDDDDQKPGSKVGFDNIWNDDLETVSTATPALSPAKPAAAGASQYDYFRYIPDEIQAKGGGFEPRSMLLLAGVIVMLVLNVASFALLL